MPDFSLSSSRRSRASLAALAVAVLSLGLVLAATRDAGAAVKHASRASARTVTPPAAAAPDPDAALRDDQARPATDVQIGPHGVKVSVDTGDSMAHGRRVVVVGPQVSVDDDGQIVRLFSDVVVPAGQRVDGDVVTVFGSSRIDGHVNGNAVAVFGSVTLGPGSAVDGDMVAVFGAVHRAESAMVGGETVDLGFEPIIPGLPPLPAILLLIGIFWVLSLIGGWIVALVMPGRLVRITATASRRMGGSLLLGVAALPLVILTVILLCITVIGIPVALLLPIAFGFVMWIGQYAGLYGLGQKLMRRRLNQGSVFAGLAAGTLFVAAFFAAGALFAGPPGILRTIALFLVAVGSLICVALQFIGCGAVLLSRFGTRPAELDAVEVPAVIAVPPAPQSAAPPPLGA